MPQPPARTIHWPFETLFFLVIGHISWRGYFPIYKDHAINLQVPTNVNFYFSLLQNRADANCVLIEMAEIPGKLFTQVLFTESEAGT